MKSLGTGSSWFTPLCVFTTFQIHCICPCCIVCHKISESIIVDQYHNRIYSSSQFFVLLVQCVVLFYAKSFHCDSLHPNCNYWSLRSESFTLSICRQQSTEWMFQCTFCLIDSHCGFMYTTCSYFRDPKSWS